MKIVLQKEAAETLKTLDFLNIPVFLIDETFTVVSCNESACSFFLYQCEQMTGKTLDTFVLPDRRNLLKLSSLQRSILVTSAMHILQTVSFHPASEERRLF